VLDQSAAYPVTARETLFTGRVWDVVAQEVTLPGGVSIRREFMAHPGAAAVIAVDSLGRVLLQRQYRAPVGALLWEPPAGLLDVPGEAPALTARRELAEEADLRATDWRRLVSFDSSPGGTSEVIHVFLARGLTPVPAGERFVREAEEALLEPVWLDLDRGVDLVMSGALRSPTAVVGLLAAARARSQPGGWDALQAA
jgi:ADP-ribose pyrophosphatase